MGRPVKYPWDDLFGVKAGPWLFPYDDRNQVRASLNQWAKSRIKKVKTRRAKLDDGTMMLEVSLSES